MRDWVDFSFYENNVFYPVNIKVSTTKTTDNLNCKLKVYLYFNGFCLFSKNIKVSLRAI